MRRSGRDIDDAVLAHIWPTHHENIHFYGTHSVDVAGELAKLGSDGYRPLRASRSGPGAGGRRRLACPGRAAAAGKPKRAPRGDANLFSSPCLSSHANEPKDARGMALAS